MATNWRGHIRAACALIVATGLVAATSGTTPARAAGGAEIVAHNGGTAWGPESTLAAFGHDIDVHAYGIEFAVRFRREVRPTLRRRPDPEPGPDPVLYRSALGIDQVVHPCQTR